MPNSFASLMLAIWPAVVFLLFARRRPDQALVWGLLGAYLLLPPPPAGFNFPLMPALDKESLPSLSVLAAALLTGQGKVRLWPQNRLLQILILLFVLSPAATYLTNTEPFLFGNTVLPGMRPTEAIGLMLLQALVLVPFLLARSLLASEDGQRTIMFALFVGGLIYSLPMLLEVRLSPQLNVWIYGYFQHVFEQMVRAGGYRPIVFLYHGLWAALFMMTAYIAALALMRSDVYSRSRVYLLLAGYLLVVLILCKSMGAMLYAMALTPLLLVLSSKAQLRLATFVAALAFCYPLLKQANMVPSDFLVAQASKVSDQRAASLQFRFDNEDVLFVRAMEKPVFGWGSWARNHLHDPRTGEITSVTDGRWILTLGRYGWVGFLAEFALLGLPLILLWLAARRYPPGDIPPLAGPLALLLAINLADLIPNATLTPLSWLIAGALLGYAGRLRSGYRAPDIEPVRTVI